MAQAESYRVQWVTPASRMGGFVERVTRSGGSLLGRSGYEISTEDLDLIDDSEAGRLSVAEFSVDADELTRQVMELSDRLGEKETLLIDLCGPRPKVQLLPVPGKYRAIVRRRDGLFRFPRSVAGFSRRHRNWLANMLVDLN